MILCEQIESGCSQEKDQIASLIKTINLLLVFLLLHH